MDRPIEDVLKDAPAADPMTWIAALSQATHIVVGDQAGNWRAYNIETGEIEDSEDSDV